MAKEPQSGMMTIISTLQSSEYNINPLHKPAQPSICYFKWNLEYLEKTIIGWGFCDIQNNQGWGKC